MTEKKSRHFIKRMYFNNAELFEISDEDKLYIASRVKEPLETPTSDFTGLWFENWVQLKRIQYELLHSSLIGTTGQAVSSNPTSFIDLNADFLHDFNEKITDAKNRTFEEPTTDWQPHPTLPAVESVSIVSDALRIYDSTMSEKYARLENTYFTMLADEQYVIGFDLVALGIDSSFTLQIGENQIITTVNDTGLVGSRIEVSFTPDNTGDLLIAAIGTTAINTIDIDNISIRFAGETAKTIEGFDAYLHVTDGRDIGTYRIVRVVSKTELFIENTSGVLHDENDIEYEIVEKISDTKYPLDSDLTITTYPFYADKVREWSKVFIDRIIPTGTQIKCRLTDEVNEFWYNGTAWVANVLNWNTIEEVTANINKFFTTEKKLAFIFNLSTTDETVTPKLLSVEALLEANFYVLEELFYRSLTKNFKEHFTPIARHRVKLAADTSSIDLAGAYKIIENDYGITNIDGVYNHSEDPDHRFNLFSSYNPSTKIITLTSSQDAASVIHIEFFYQPVVVFTTNTDYVELSKTPTIEFRSVSDPKAGIHREMSEQTPFFDEINNELVIPPVPTYQDFIVNCSIYANRGIDMIRLNEEIYSYFSEIPFVFFRATGEYYDINLIDKFTFDNDDHLRNLHRSGFTLKISNVKIFTREVTSVRKVERFFI